MRVRFVPENKKFYSLLQDASRNAVDISRLLVELLDRFP